MNSNNSPKQLTFSIAALVAAITLNSVAQDADPDPSIVSRGPHDLAVTSVTLSNGIPITNTLTKVATGMHYWDGEWKESQDCITLAPDGSAIAIEGPIKARFSADLSEIMFRTPGEQVFRTRPLALYYFDATSGKAVRLATVRNVPAGELLPPNQCLWRGIFSPNSIEADLRVTYTKAAIESDLILLERPSLTPEDCGMNPATTQLQLWHVWETTATHAIRPRVLKETTDPVLRQQMVEPDFVDNTLAFDEGFFGPGRAYPINPPDARALDQPAKIRISSPSQPGHIHVAKQWVEIGKQIVLIESTCWTDIEPHLKTLPVAPALSRPETKDRNLFLNETPLEFPSTRAGTEFTVITVPYAPNGLLIDWFWAHTSGFNFAAGQTYWGLGTLYANNVTFNAGCVVKFDRSYGGLHIAWPGSITCYGTSQNPSVITTQDDDTQGEILPTSTHIPSYNMAAALFLDFDNAQLQGLKVRWAWTGIELDSYMIPTISDSTVEFCGTGITTTTPAELINVGYCTVSQPLVGYFYGQIIDLCDADADGNNMGDWWEYRHFGTTQRSDTEADPDYDGLTNYQEFTTNPQTSNPLDWPSIGSMSVSPAQYVTFYPEIPGAVVKADRSITASAAYVVPAAIPKQWALGRSDYSPTSWVRYPETGLSFTTPTLTANHDHNIVQLRAYHDFGNAVGWGSSATNGFYLAVLDTAEWARYQTFVSLIGSKTINQLTTIGSSQSPPTRNTDSFIHGRRGFTAISQHNEWQEAVGQGSVTLITPRHGYMRGHGCSAAHKVGKKVWFYTADSTLVETTVVAALTRNSRWTDPPTPGFQVESPTESISLDPLDPSRDYTILLFSEDLTLRGIGPIRWTPVRSDYGWPLHVYLQICMGGRVWASIPPYQVGDPEVSGNSGNPDLLLTGNGELVFFGGSTCSPPQMILQEDLNRLTDSIGLPNYLLQVCPENEL